MIGHEMYFGHSFVSLNWVSNTFFLKKQPPYTIFSALYTPKITKEKYTLINILECQQMNLLTRLGRRKKCLDDVFTVVKQLAIY